MCSGWWCSFWASLHSSSPLVSLHLWTTTLLYIESRCILFEDMPNGEHTQKNCTRCVASSCTAVLIRLYRLHKGLVTITKKMPLRGRGLVWSRFAIAAIVSSEKCSMSPHQCTPGWPYRNALNTGCAGVLDRVLSGRRHRLS